MPSRSAVERAARAGRKQAERAKAVKRGQAQAVHAADDRRVAQARRDHARRVCRTPWRWKSTRSKPPGTVRSGRDRTARTRRPNKCCAWRHSESPRAARRCVRHGGDRPARSNGCPRCWCRGTRRCARRRSGPELPAPRRRSRPASARVAPGGCCGSRIPRGPRAPAAARHPPPGRRRFRSCAVSKAHGASPVRRARSALTVRVDADARRCWQWPCD